MKKRKKKKTISFVVTTIYFHILLRARCIKYRFLWAQLELQLYFGTIGAPVSHQFLCDVMWQGAMGVRCVQCTSHRTALHVSARNWWFWWWILFDSFIMNQIAFNLQWWFGAVVIWKYVQNFLTEYWIDGSFGGTITFALSVCLRCLMAIGDDAHCTIQNKMLENSCGPNGAHVRLSVQCTSKPPMTMKLYQHLN